MDQFIDLKEKIIQRPEVYIGKPSVERLYAFLNGYLHRSQEVSYDWNHAFNGYVANHYGITSAHNWADIIVFFSSNENEAFASFATHFHAFISSNAFIFNCEY